MAEGGREPRFTMCALSGRWANRARAGNGGLQAKSRIHTIGHEQPSKLVLQSGRPHSSNRTTTHRWWHPAVIAVNAPPRPRSGVLDRNVVRQVMRQPSRLKSEARLESFESRPRCTKQTKRRCLKMKFSCCTCHLDSAAI